MANGSNHHGYIQSYLALNPPTSGQPVSTLAMAIHEARSCSGRNLMTGVKNTGPNQHHDSWSGALIYLSLLDQIGEVLDLIGATPASYVHSNTFLKALDIFRVSNEPENKALYALRCSFAHDFGLINEPPNHDSLLRHHFTVCGGTSVPLVTLPSTPWGGYPAAQTNDNVTRINLELLGDSVEAMFVNLVELNNNNELRIALGDGVNELNAKYFQFFWTSP